MVPQCIISTKINDDDNVTIKYCKLFSYDKNYIQTSILNSSATTSAIYINKYYKLFSYDKSYIETSIPSSSATTSAIYTNKYYKLFSYDKSYIKTSIVSSSAVARTNINKY